MKPENYFLNPKSAQHRQYEALRTFYLTDLSAEETAKKFNFSPAYFKKLRFEFSKNLREGKNIFFSLKSPDLKKDLQAMLLLTELLHFVNRIILLTILKLFLTVRKEVYP